MLGLFKWSTPSSARSAAILRRYSRRHVIAGSLFVWSLVTWTTGHVSSYESCWRPSAHGHQRGVLPSGGAGLIADVPAARRARGDRLAPDGDLRGGDRRRVRRLLADPPRPRLALGLRRLRSRWHRLHVPLFVLCGTPPPRAAPDVPQGSSRDLARPPRAVGNGSSSSWCSISRCRRLADGSCATDAVYLKAEFGIGRARRRVGDPVLAVAAIVGGGRGWLADGGCEATRAAASSQRARDGPHRPAMFGLGYAPETGRYGAVAF